MSGKPCDFYLGDCRNCGKRADRDNQNEPCTRPNGPFAPTTATPSQRLDAATVERVCDAVRGIADDYQTSEQHHPGHVLIPVAKFEQLRVASEKLS